MGEIINTKTILFIYLKKYILSLTLVLKSIWILEFYLLLLISRENNVSSMDFSPPTFVVEYHFFGQTTKYNLKENGESVQVTEENKNEYVQ